MHVQVIHKVIVSHPLILEGGYVHLVGVTPY